MTKDTNVVKILEQAIDLGEKVKENDNVKQDVVMDYIYQTLGLIKNLTKTVDDLEERLELLEEIMEK